MKKLAVTILLAPMLAQATLTPNLPGRGSQKVGLSRNEICVIPNRLGGLKTDGTPKADYSEKDAKNEAKLCGMDIKTSTTNIAACAKTNSTNPGVQFFEIPKGATVAQIEAIKCEENSQFPKIKKLAKYKNSTSCSYTPAILSYYHVSRFLGDINQVPVSVLRTLDLNVHKAIGKTIDSSDPTKITWDSLLMYLNQGKNNTKKDKMHGLFTDDFTQSYGALQKNATKEEFYAEVFNKVSKEELAKAQAKDPKVAMQYLRAMKFKTDNPTYANLANPGSLNSMGFTSFNQNNLQAVLRMQNVADMILLDTILSQEDRFGNLAYTVEAYAMQKDETGKMNVKKLKELEDGQTYPAGTIQVKKMMMKDNDCGVNRANHLKKAQLLEGVRHFNPETFKKLLNLYKIINTQEGQDFFKRETAMIDTDVQTFKTNVAHATNVLVNACKAGQLSLDLDLDVQFAGEAAQDCRVIIQAAQAQ